MSEINMLVRLIFTTFLYQSSIAHILLVGRREHDDVSLVHRCPFQEFATPLRIPATDETEIKRQSITGREIIGGEKLCFTFS